VPQARQRPADETGRGDGTDADTLGGCRDDTTANTAVDRLPIPIRARYIRDCAMWRAIHAHYLAIRHLLARARP